MARGLLWLGARVLVCGRPVAPQLLPAASTLVPWRSPGYALDHLYSSGRVAWPALTGLFVM
jgi:hypothetical protein